MKIILTGAAGLMGTECIRQALKHPHVSGIVALARRPVKIPDDVSPRARTCRFRSVVIEDFGAEYSEDVKAELKGADACIWNLALTLSRARKQSFEEARKTCLDYTLAGLKTMAAVANPDHPFRFVYTSSVLSERDQNSSLWWQSRYRKMRGEVESELLNYASSNREKLKVQITKPGLIDNPCLGIVTREIGKLLVPHIDVSEIAAAELDQVVRGFRYDVLENADLVRIGRNALKRQVEERVEKGVVWSA